jgi:uncharacterized protein YegP (UPF0339 family)
MSFFKKLFGRKKDAAQKAMDAKTAREAEEAELIAAGILTEKPKAEKSEITKEAPKPKKAPAEKETKKAAKPVAKKEKSEPKEKVSEKIEEDAPAEKTDEEIDASFTETPGDVSEEIAQAEAKSGRALARFEIKKAKDGRFVFNLYAPNRVIVATSQIYSSSTSAVNGIKSIAANAPKAPIEDTTLKTFTPVGFPKWEIYLDKGGQYRFRLYAPNGSCIVHSQGYTTKSSCKNGIASIAKNAPDALVDKSYLKPAER